MSAQTAAPLPLNPAGHSFLVTGGAGFIGSHIVRHLVNRGGRVRVLDLFTTGRRENLADTLDRIDLIVGDICDRATVRRAVEGVQYVLHLAALASVPQSIDDPELNFNVNLSGTQNLLLAARAAAVRRFVFSSSAAVYGHHPAPHHERLVPHALSPYAAAKLGSEQLCLAVTQVYGLPTVCLRYFNVFGPYQNPRSDYAAAIPIFISRLLSGQRPCIFGDGLQSRDFVYVANVVEANLRACGTDAAVGGVFNIATGRETNLLELLAILKELTGQTIEPEYAAPRAGEVRHSYGDITEAATKLGYQPAIDLAEGLRQTVAWYRQRGAGF